MTDTAILRPATPTDAEFLAWALNEAAGDLFRVMYGKRYARVLAKVISQTGHDFSYQHAMVAELDGVAVGTCQGFGPDTPSADGALMRAAGLRMVRAAWVTLLALPVLTALGKREPDQWYLQAIAVRPENRGARIGSMLLQDAFARARRAHCTALALDVDSANTRAIELYERLGLSVMSTSRQASLLGGVRIKRMVAPVPAG